MKPFKAFFREQQEQLTENAWKKIAYSKGGEFSVPGSTTAAIRRLNQAGKTASRPTRGAVQSAIQDAAVKASNRKMGGLYPGMVSKAFSGKAGLADIQQASKKQLASGLARQVGRQKNILSRAASSAPALTNPANKINWAKSAVPTSDPNFMKSVGKVTNTGKGMLKGPDVITSGGNITRNLATGRAAKDAVTSVIQDAPAMVVGGAAYAPGKAALTAAGKTSAGRATGKFASKALSKTGQFLRPTGNLGRAAAVAAPVTGVGRSLNKLASDAQSGMAGPDNPYGINKMDVARGTFTGLKNMSKAERGAIAGSFAKSKEGFNTAVGLGAEIAGGVASPTALVGTRSPGAYSKWTKTKDAMAGAAAKATGQEGRSSFVDNMMRSQEGMRGMGKISQGVTQSAANRRKATAARDAARAVKDQAKAAYQATQGGGLTGRNMPKQGGPTMSVSSALQRSGSKDPRVGKTLSHFKTQASKAHGQGSGRFRVKGYMDPAPYKAPNVPKKKKGFFGSLFGSNK